MGPRSDNRGYGSCKDSDDQMLVTASMGPRSDNRGYVISTVDDADAATGFNGSTVR